MERIERIRAAGNNNNGPVGPYHLPPLPPPITGDVVNELRHLIDQSDCYTVETIELGYRLTVFANLLHGYVLNDESRLSDLFGQLNETALSDDQFAPKMAFVFASQQLGALSPLDHSIRNAMITKLQDNYGAKDQLKQAGRHRFYNSITLLGEYYHRKRDAHGKRFHILGEKLLALLTSELEQEMKQCGQQQQPPQDQFLPAYPTIDPAFAKVILSQITLNGEVAREELRQEITELMLMVRKCLLTVPNLCEWTKAFLLMALDFYHANLPQDVFDRLYTKYLLEEPKLDPVPAPAPVPVMMESPVPASIPMDAPYYEPLSPELAIGYFEEESIDGLHSHLEHGATNHHHLPSLPPSPQPPPPAQIVTAAPLEAPPKERNAVSNKENKRRPPSRHEHARARHSSNQRKKLDEPESGISHPPVTSPPTTPTSRKGTTVPPRTVTVVERSPPDAKKGLASPPRPAEKLANLPKLTVTTTNTAVQSRKQSAASTAPLSPRGVLVVSSGRQQPVVQPPKSPSSRAARNGTAAVAAAGATNNNTKASQHSDQYSNSSSSRRGGGGNDRRIPSKYIIPRFAAQQRKEQEARAANAAAHTATTAAGAPLRNGSSGPAARGGGGGGGGNVLKQQQQQQHAKNTGTGPKANGQPGHQRPPRSPSKTKPSDWYSHDDRRGPASRSSRKQEQPKKTTTTNGDGNGGQLGGKPVNPPQNPVWDWAAEDDDYYEPEPRAAPERHSGAERATYEQRKEQMINWATEEDAKPVPNAAPAPTKPIVWDWAADDDDDYQPVAVNGSPGGNNKQTIVTKTKPSPPRPREPKKWDWAADEDEEDDYVAYSASAGSSNTGGGGKNLPERDIGALSTAYKERLSLDGDRRSARKPNPKAHA